MRILSPEGRVGEAPAALASSPEVLGGLRIAVLDNGKPGAELLMGEIAEQIGARCGARVAPPAPGGSGRDPRRRWRSSRRCTAGRAAARWRPRRRGDPCPRCRTRRRGCRPSPTPSPWRGASTSTRRGSDKRPPRRRCEGACDGRSRGSPPRPGRVGSAAAGGSTAAWGAAGRRGSSCRSSRRGGWSACGQHNKDRPSPPRDARAERSGALQRPRSAAIRASIAAKRSTHSTL